MVRGVDIMSDNNFRPNIILTGFMGCGKTTVGRLLAAELGRAFIDTDHHITRQQGLSVAQIFAVRGENAFRRLERRLAVELAVPRSLVIATGGRMLLDPVNAGLLARGGTILSLIAAPAEILRRLKADRKHPRPLLDGDLSASRIEKLLEERRAGYASFPQIKTDGRKPAEIVREILQVVVDSALSPGEEL